MIQMSSMAETAKLVFNLIARPDSGVNQVAGKVDTTIMNSIQNDPKFNWLKVDKVSMTDAVQSGDFTKIIKSALIEPSIVVTKNAIFTEVIDQVNNVIVDNFVAYYIQVFDILTKLNGYSADMAIDIMSTNLYTVKDLKDKIEDRIIDKAFSEGTGLIEKIKNELSKEQIDFGLETDKHLHNLKLDSSHMLLNTEEWNNIKIAEKIERVSPMVKSALGLESVSNSEFENRDLFKSIFDPDNGTLAKTLTRQFTLTLRCKTNIEKERRNTNANWGTKFVPVGNGDNRASPEQMGYDRPKYDFEIPIICKATVKVVNVEEIAAVMTSKDMRKTFFARIKEFKSGAIGLWDLLWCDDLIKDYKAQKLGKNSTLLNTLEEQNTAATLRKYFTGTKGFETAYNSVVLTKDEANYISKVYGKDIMTNKGKDEFLGNLNAFMCCVLDTNNERANIMMKRIDGNADIQWKAFARRRDNTNNVLDFFKAINGGTAIRF